MKIVIYPCNGGFMRFLIMVLLSMSFMEQATADTYDSNNRQACIDELKSEVEKVCDPKIQENMNSIMGMLKDSGFIAQTDSRVKRICSYHCPQDITEKCYALLGRGPGLLQDVMSGKVNAKQAYADGCRALQGRIEVAQKELADKAGKVGKGTGPVDNGFAKGSFRKPSANSPAPAATPSKPAKCNPYNSSGAYEMGKCPN